MFKNILIYLMLLFVSSCPLLPINDQCKMMYNNVITTIWSRLDPDISMTAPGAILYMATLVIRLHIF